MPNINNIARVPQNNNAFNLNQIENLARTSSTNSKLVLKDGQFTRHGTNVLSRAFSNLADRFSSKRAEANKTSLNAFKQEILDTYRGADLQQLGINAMLTGAKSLTAGLVTRCLEVINPRQEGDTVTGDASLRGTPSETPRCSTLTPRIGQKADDYGINLADDYTAKAQNMPEQRVENFAEQYVEQVTRDLEASHAFPSAYLTLSSMKAAVDEPNQESTALALNKAIDSKLLGMSNPNLLKPTVTTLHTAVQVGAPLRGRPIDASTLKPTNAGQGTNMCFVMSAVRSMLNSPSMTQSLLNRIHVDDGGGYHVRLTKLLDFDTQEFLVDVPALAIQGHLYESNEARPKAFAALECAIANTIVEQNLDPEYTVGTPGFGQNTLSLLGFETVEDPANMYQSPSKANFTASLKNFLSQPNNVVILRTPDSGGHWLSILPSEGDNVIIGDSLNPTEQRSMSLSELHETITQGGYGYQLSGGTLPS